MSLQAFIDKFRYNAKRASMVQSRIKALERLEELEAVEQDPEYVFRCSTNGVVMKHGGAAGSGCGMRSYRTQGGRADCEKVEPIWRMSSLAELTDRGRACCARFRYSRASCPSPLQSMLDVLRCGHATVAGCLTMVPAVCVRRH